MTEGHNSLDFSPPTVREGPLLCIHHIGPGYAVLEKVSGLLSVPGHGPEKIDSIQYRVKQAFPKSTGPISPHRLDQDTSGLIIVALNPLAHRHFATQFQDRKVEKTYLARVEGVITEEGGEIDLPLIVDWPKRPRQKVCYEEGRPAQTRYRVLQRSENNTLVEFQPITGRSHQLRVHAATPRESGGLGCPILGDSLYGNPKLAPRLLLHASHLAFAEPKTNSWLQFDSPSPF